MNYCTKCGSIYSQPGTCNCFARGTVIPSPLPIQPITPWSPITPTWIPPVGTGTIRYRCYVCGREDCTSHITVQYAPPDGASFSWTVAPLPIRVGAS